VIDDICLFNQIRHEAVIGDGVYKALKTWDRLQVPNVFRGPGRKIVHDLDFVAPFQQAFRQM
jgi:hypothetical protein